MRYILLTFIFFSQHLFSEALIKADLLKGSKAVTVYSSISPHSLDIAFESALANALSSWGKVTYIRSDQSFSENFYTAISNPIFLQLSLRNWVIETENKQFKVQMQLVLECTKRDMKSKSETTDPTVVWIGDESFDFSPDEQILTERGKQAAARLSKQFLEIYQLQDSKAKGQITFFVL